MTVDIQSKIKRKFLQLQIHKTLSVSKDV